MLSTLQRYLFKQFFFTSLNTIGLFVFVLIVGNALKEVLPLLASGKIEWSFFFNTLFHLIPSMVAYALPLGMLTATLLVLGKLSSQNELIAMKASGLSLYYILAPLMLLASLGTIFALCVNYYWGPNSITYYRSALSNIIREKPLKFIQAGTFVKDFPGYMFYIEKKSNDWVDHCWLWELDGSQASGVNVFLHSEKGFLRYDEQQNSIVLTLLQGVGEKYTTHPDGKNEIQTIAFDNTSVALPLTNLLGTGTFSKRLGYMTLSELLQNRMPVKHAKAGTNGFSQKIAVNLEIQKSAVMSFAVLSLILIAIPLGIKLSRAETSANIVLAVGLALSFYFIVMAISWLESKPLLRPDMLIWLPNIIFQILGLFLIKRALKH